MVALALIAGATVFPATAANAAEPPVAIPPSALGECSTDKTTGGWDQRMFVSNFSDVATDIPTRPKGVKFGEPCYKDGKLTIPELAYDLADEDAIANGEFEPPASSDDLNCPVLTEGYVRDWGPIGPEIGYCLGIPLKIGTGYKPDPGEWDNGGTATVTDLVLKTTGPHTGEWEYKVSYDPVKPSGSPYPGGAISYYAMCRYEGTNNWDNPDGAGFSFASVQLTDGNPVDVTFWMQATCNGARNPSHTGGPIGGGYFGTTDEPPILVAYRNVGTSSASGADATYYGNVVTLVHSPGATSFEGGAGMTIGGQAASSIQIEGSADLTTGGYVVCATNTAGEGQYTVNMTHRVKYGKDYPRSQNPDGDTDPFESYESEYRADTPYIDGASCPYVMQVVFKIVTWTANGGPTAISTATWSYTLYRDAKPYTDGDDLPTFICTGITSPSGQCIDVLFPDPNKPEPAIICEIEYSDPGNPITVIGEFFGGLGPWVGCMFTPKGWDRFNKVEKAWESGTIGEMSGAFRAAVPDGITCGTIADIPLPNTSGVELNTCSTDIAPPLVKSVLSWIIVLGLCVLMVRRIMWSVGSKG